MRKRSFNWKYVWALLWLTMFIIGLATDVQADPYRSSAFHFSLDKHILSGSKFALLPHIDHQHHVSVFHSRKQTIPKNKSEKSLHPPKESFTEQPLISKMARILSPFSDIRPCNDSSCMVTMFIRLDASLESSQLIVRNSQNPSSFSTLWEMSQPLASYERLRLRHLVFNNYTVRDEKIYLSRNNDMIFKSFSHPFHNGAISLSVPIPVTSSFMIAPAVIYAFSINNGVNQEYRGKALFTLIDKESAIVYTGIHFLFTF